mmetsp:Transcript_25594/g.31909  ORF Transcript_25594/g.31909 Transcript_25594/m.31909 type:complete len:144 (-) Transcript_25594:124-555(-)
MPPKGNSKAKESPAGKKKAKTNPSEPVPANSNYAEMLRSKKLFEFDIVGKVDNLLEGENSRTPTQNGVEKIASKIANDGYADVYQPMVVELRDRTQVQQSISRLYFLSTEVSNEDETLYEEIEFKFSNIILQHADYAFFSTAS